MKPPPERLEVSEDDEGLLDGRYRLHERLNTRAAGPVYKAEDVWLGRWTALKILAPARQNDVPDLDRLKREARALATIRHDNVVQVYAFGPLGDAFYLAMELVDGGNLHEELTRLKEDLGSFETTRALDTIRAIGRGLSAVHQSNMVHGDVNPTNIVIERCTDRPVLIDFAIARRKQGSNPKLRLARGSASYMAPEQACDLPNVGPHADLYSLACTAFEIFTGEPPFGDGDPEALVRAHIERPPPVLSVLRPDLRPLDKVLACALAKDPGARHETCAAFVRDLDRAASALPRDAPPRRLRDRGPHQTEVIRTLVLERNPGLLRQIVRTAERCLREAAKGVEIECVSSSDQLAEAFARERSDIVIVDEDEQSPACDETLASLRDDGAEILILRHASSVRTKPIPGVRELKKPMNAHVLAAVLTRMTTRIRER